VTDAPISMDTSAAVRMFEQLAARGGEIPATVQQVANETRVTGIPVRTGALASSPRVERTTDGAQIVSDVPYALYVFHGFTHVGGTQVAARPPQLDGPDLAEAIARELFR